MNRDELLKSLQPGGQEIVLSPRSPALGHLGTWLQDATDTQDQIVIKSAKIDGQAPKDSLIVSGKANLLGVETNVKAVFQLADGAVARYYLLAVLPDGWRLQQSFPGQLPGYRGASSFFEAFQFNKPLLVLTAGQNLITDNTHGLADEAFDNGLNFYAAGLTTPLPVDEYGVGSLPAFGQGFGATPSSVKGRLDVKAKNPEIRLLCWYTSTQQGKLGAAKVLSMGLGFQSAIGTKPAGEPLVSWLWELELPGEAPFVVAAQMPRDPKQTPTFQASFEAARHLAAGLNALGPVAGDQDLSAATPSGVGPSFNLATLSFRPGELMAASFVLLDSGTGEPYEWEAVPGLVKVKRSVLAVQAFLKPKQAPRVGVSGIAVIGGYPFEVAVTPGESVSGYLVSPHDIDVEAYVKGLFGHDLGFPNLHLRLLVAAYSYDIPSKSAHYALAVGGNLDLLGNGALVLQDIGFDYDSQDGKPTGRRLSGSVAVAGNPILVSAEYQADSGWEFAGQANPYKLIPLNRLAEDLVHVWGAPMPPGLPEIALYQLSLRFSVRRKLLRAWARTRWEPPKELPWYKGEIDALGDLSSWIDPATARRQTELSLEWSYTYQQLIFWGSVKFGPSGRSFSISWDGGTTKTLGLRSLWQALQLDSVCMLPDGADWKIFDFQRLAVGYSSEPRYAQLTAASRLGDGDLVLSGNLAKGSRSVDAVWTGDKEECTLVIDTLLQAVGLPLDVPLPGSIGKDVFEFDRLAVRYEADPDVSVRFLGESRHAFYKELFLVVTKGTGGWGLIAGAAFKDKTKLTDIPGIGDLPGLGEVLKNLSIEPVYLLVSTIDKPSFLPPIFQPGLGTAFGAVPYNKNFVTPGTLVAKSPFGRASLKLSKGASVAARINLQDSRNVIFENVYRLTGLKELDGRVTAGPDGIEVMGMLPGQLKIPTGSGGSFTLSNAFLAVDCSKAAVTTVKIGGGTKINLFGDLRQVDVALMVGEEAADASIHLKGVPLPSPQLLPGVRFKNECWLEIGAQFEPEGLDLGFMADFYIGDDPNKYTGKAVVVLEMIEEIPNPLYIQFSIDQLDLWAWFEAQTGVMAALDVAGDAVHAADKTEVAKKTGAAVAGGLSGQAIEYLKSAYKNLQPIFQKVVFRDVAMHWADSLVILPDGTTALPGVGFRGWLDIFGFHTFAAFEFSVNMPPTLSGRFEMEPVSLQGVLTIAGDGKGVRLREAKGQEGWDYWKDAGRNKESLKRQPAASAGEYIVHPGGPVFVVSGQHAPFLHADIHFTLFKVLHTDLQADVDEHGFSFKVTSGAGSIANLTLTCKLAVQGGFRFDASGRFDLHLDGEIDLKLFTVHLDCGLDGEIDVFLTEKEFRVTVNGTFEYKGAELHLPELVIGAPFASFEELPGKIWSHVEDNAEDLFADFFHGMGHLIEEGAKAVKEVGEKAYHEVEKIGGEAVEKAKEAEHRVAEAAGKADEEISKAAIATQAKAAETLDKAKKEVGEIAGKAEAEARQLFDDGKKVMDAAARTAGEVGKAVGEEVSKIEHQIADVANQAAHEVAEIAGAVAHEVQHLLDDAGKAARAVMQEAAEIAGKIGEEAKQLWHKAEAVWDDVKNLARKAEEALESAAEKLTSWL